jgi:hypothetical protein
MIVGADVEYDRQGVLRGNTRTSRIESESSERNAHAASAEIPEAQDALSVRHDDEPHLLLWPVSQKLLDTPSRSDRDIHAPWLTEYMAKFLTRLTDGGRERSACKWPGLTSELGRKVSRYASVDPPARDTSAGHRSVPRSPRAYAPPAAPTC